MEVETQLKTFCIDPNLMMTSSAPDFSNQKLRVKTDILLMSSGFPIDFDVGQNLCAFVYTEINQESVIDSLMGRLESSSLGSNVYIKGAASKIMNIGHSSMETISNLLNV